jgi:hypothetical protein
VPVVEFVFWFILGIVVGVAAIVASRSKDSSISHH